MAIDWENFLDPYIQAVGELKIKLRGIRKQYRKQQKHSPIEFVTGRVKPIESIREKMIRRNISEENLAQDMQDIAGLRIMVQFVDDVDEILEVLRQRQDMRVGPRARLHPPQEIKWLPELPRRGRVSGRYH